MDEKTHVREGGAPVVGIVAPCFNEEEVVEETGARLSAVLDALAGSGKAAPESFVYFVDDGSIDSTWALIEKMAARNSRIKGLKLSRNFGHQNSLLAGLMTVRERVDCAISIDADLQQDEKAVPEFIDKYMKGADVVFGLRRKRDSDSFFKKFTALAFYRVMRLMGANVIENHSDYRLASRRALDVIAEYREVNLFLRGIFRDIGLVEEFVFFDVKEREFGESKYSMRKMASFALNGITSFSVAPLRIISFTGFVVFLASLAMIAYIIGAKFISGQVVPGWASTLIPIYSLGGLQLLGIGVVGEYIGKMYKETKARPRYIKEKEII